MASGHANRTKQSERKAYAACCLELAKADTGAPCRSQLAQSKHDRDRTMTTLTVARQCRLKASALRLAIYGMGTCSGSASVEVSERAAEIHC
jgi:hypothetical protein